MRTHLSLIPLLAACASGSTGVPSSGATTAPPRIERVGSPAEGVLVNAYLVETPRGVVVIDALLRVSDARTLRARVDAIGKPLLGVLLTHGHPDHYNGVAVLIDGHDVPVIATRAVDEVIRTHDAAKETQWKPMFGDEWPARRAFPSRTIAEGGAVTLDGLSFRVHAVGPAESHADTYWTIDGVPEVAFIGDLAYPDLHAYVTDAHTAAWIDVLERLERELPANVTLYPGHGEPGGRAMLAAQRAYLAAVRAEIARLSPDGRPLTEAAKAELATAIKRHRPTEQLLFLVGLGADAVAAELAAAAE